MESSLLQEQDKAESYLSPYLKSPHLYLLGILLKSTLKEMSWSA